MIRMNYVEWSTQLRMTGTNGGPVEGGRVPKPIRGGDRGAYEPSHHADTHWTRLFPAGSSETIAHWEDVSELQAPLHLTLHDIDTR